MQKTHTLTYYKTRGALSNPGNRFETQSSELVDDGWYQEPKSKPIRLTTSVLPDKAKSVISRNNSPDVPFDYSVNPYRGCEHGCIYCFARPTHAYLDLSPGLDFETKLFYKADAVNLLRKELLSPGYQCKPIALGINTDAYQPLEKKWN